MLPFVRLSFTACHLITNIYSQQRLDLCWRGRLASLAMDAVPIYMLARLGSTPISRSTVCIFWASSSVLRAIDPREVSWGRKKTRHHITLASLISSNTDSEILQSPVFGQQKCQHRIRRWHYLHNECLQH